MYCYGPYNNILEYSPHKSLHSPAQDTLFRVNYLSSQEMLSKSIIYCAIFPYKVCRGHLMAQHWFNKLFGTKYRGFVTGFQ